MTQLQFVTEDYISDIPWNNNPALCFIESNNVYEEAFKNVIEFVPNTQNRIKFKEDVWDFRQFFKEINSPSYILHFGLACEDYKEFLKFFVIYRISHKSKISTINLRVSDFIHLINKVKSNNHDKPFSLITTEDIASIIESKKSSDSRKHGLYASAYSIYDFIIKNYSLEYPINLDFLKERSAKHRKDSLSFSNKIPNIPEEYYNDIINKAYEVFNNASISFNSRMTAGMIIIVSQTGLRLQDLLGLKTNDLKATHLPISNISCHYIHFKSRKPSKAHSKMLEFDIFSSELCSEVFNKMIELRKQCKFSNEPFLYVLDSIYNSTNTFPIASSRFTREYNKFFFEHLKNQSSKKWKGISPIKYKSICNNALHIPSISQFRVHLATSLYNNGVSLVYIQRYLGHLSEYMLGYYSRPADTSQENADYAARIVKKIVCGDGDPIGLMGHDLKKNLISFIENNNYNVELNTQEILKHLGDKLVIREKGGGLCCIKTSFVPCKHDARTNATLCAYGLCPNIFHFYDSIDVSYMQFHALQKAYESNLEHGLDRAADKELQKIKDFITRRLKPELNELKRITVKYGTEPFCLEHPDLRYIATHIDNIYKEIELWENF